jgi:protein phosphatase
MGQATAWRGAGLTDRGRVRTSNQDAFAILDDLGLWVVADGMGGGPGGDIASRIAVDSFATALKKGKETPSQQSVTHALRQAIQVANEAIRAAARKRRELTGMGTTLVAAYIPASSTPDGSSSQVTVLHVGDSRAYLFRHDTLTAMTRDHSWVEEQIRQGNLTPEHAAAHPLRHVLSRAVGSQAKVEPDTSSHTLQPGDRLLLCTDGLTKMLTDAEILAILLKQTGSGAAACRALVDEANRRGGEDNVTVILVSEEG